MYSELGVENEQINNGGLYLSSSWIYFRRRDRIGKAGLGLAPGYSVSLGLVKNYEIFSDANGSENILISVPNEAVSQLIM
jgi:hypothetical protein